MNRGVQKPDLKPNGLDTDNLQKGGITVSQSLVSDPRQIQCQTEREDGMKISMYCKLVYSALCFTQSSVILEPSLDHTGIVIYRGGKHSHEGGAKRCSEFKS